MGMAASQARYIELTARKTNVEYEGQQINQQRTALSNESAGLFSQLMALDVPVPPSTNDYTTTGYTFSDGANNYTITDIQTLNGDPNYNKTVTYYYDTSEYTGIAKERSDLGVMGVYSSSSVNYTNDGTDNYTTTTGSYAVSQVSDASAATILEAMYGSSYTGNISDYFTYNDGSDDYYVLGSLLPSAADVTGNATTYDSTAGPTYWLTNGTTTKKTRLEQCVNDATDDNYETDYAALLQVCKDNPTSQLATDVGYNSSTETLSDISGAYKYTATSGTTYYYSGTDLAAASTEGGDSTLLSSYYAAYLNESIYNTSDAYLETEDSGRFSEITLDGYSSSFSLTAATTTDENAYNDAMNEYVYQQTLYEQQVNDINAQTEIIEEEDRTLEMKLKQLDTEQEALQTEMESVKKVIDKNIEQTFKTFQ